MTLPLGSPMRAVPESAMRASPSSRSPEEPESGVAVGLGVEVATVPVTRT